MLEMFLAFALLQAPATPPPSAAPTLDLDPPQVMVMPGQPFKVKAKTNASTVFYDVDGVHQAPEDWPIADRKVNFYGLAPQTNGQFTLTATVYANDQRVIKKIPIIVGATPIPPVPGPTPTPTDPLFPELQAMFTESKSITKLADAHALAALYSTAGQAALKDTTVTTTGQFLAKLKAASKLMLPDDALPKIRDRLKSEFAICLGTADVPLTPELRTKASDCLNRLALLLGALR